jgi:thiamine-phosphate pyrophosphorylase
MSEQRLRIIDANLNRAGEGLHLLEEIARLTLDDAELTRKLKAMRHEVLRGDLTFNKELIQARDSEGDVGVAIKTPGEEKELPIILVANSRRVQEALRVLEEMAKVPDVKPKLDLDKFKKARFDLYTIERALLSRLLRRDKAGRLNGLYAIIDSQKLGKRDHVEVAGQLIRGGAKAIQLRYKGDDRDESLAIAKKLKSLCYENKVLFIVNDYLDIALAAGADGLHLGQKDLPVKEARQLLPIDMLLGVSVTTVEQAKAAEGGGADYIAVGSMYPTGSKETARVVGLERLREVRGAVSLPLVAIGGINRDNAGEVAAAGADGVAVISAILGVEDVEGAARQLIKAFEAGK